MSALEDYHKSLRNSENTWARTVATRVHFFYREVLDGLSEKYEDWYMDLVWGGDRGDVQTALHLFALDELVLARLRMNHPTMQLHEFVVVADQESFADKFKAMYDDGVYTDQSNKVIKDNTHQELIGDLRHNVAREISERYGNLAFAMSDETFSEKWDEIYGELQDRGYRYRAQWSA